MLRWIWLPVVLMVFGLAWWWRTPMPTSADGSATGYRPGPALTLAVDWSQGVVPLGPVPWAPEQLTPNDRYRWHLDHFPLRPGGPGLGDLAPGQAGTTPLGHRSQIPNELWSEWPVALLLQDLDTAAVVGRVSWTTESSPLIAQPPAACWLHPDGLSVVTWGLRMGRSSVALLSLPNGLHRRQLLEPFDGRVVRGWFDPQGDHWACLSRTDSGEQWLMIVPLRRDTGSIQPTLPDPHIHFGKLGFTADGQHLYAEGTLGGGAGEPQHQLLVWRNLSPQAWMPPLPAARFLNVMADRSGRYLVALTSDQAFQARYTLVDVVARQTRSLEAPAYGSVIGFDDRNRLVLRQWDAPPAEVHHWRYVFIGLSGAEPSSEAWPWQAVSPDQAQIDQRTGLPADLNSQCVLSPDGALLVGPVPRTLSRGSVRVPLWQTAAPGPATWLTVPGELPEMAVTFTPGGRYLVFERRRGSTRQPYAYAPAAADEP